MAVSPDSVTLRPSETVSRRDLLRLMALSPVALGLSGVAEAAPGVFPRFPNPELTAGRWLPWLVSSAGTLLPPAPPARNSAQTQAELQELLNIQSARSDILRALVRFWDLQGGIPVWSQVLLDTVKSTSTNPVRAARALALLHTAIADATIAVWNAKFAYRRAQPSQLNRRLISLAAVHPALPSYPSEHAAIAGAAAAVLNYLYPGGTAQLLGRTLTFDQAAAEAGASRLWAGANFRSDVNAGFAIGQAVGALAVRRGQNDGSGAAWDPVTQPGRLFGPQYWVPTPPANAFPPLLPLAGQWRPWVLAAGNQFRPGPPPALAGAFPSEEFLREAAEVKQTVDNLTPEQLQIARFWADNPGASFTPPGHWAAIAAAHVAAAGLSTPRAARALALVAAGLADSAIACWDCKYAYWILRPITAIRTLSGQPFYDPNFLTPVVTPAFPAYTSGHSTFSGCSAAVLEHLFPGGKVSDAFGQSLSFEDAAGQAALSRLYGGIHYQSDNEVGLTCGRHVAGVVLERARHDGAR
jgi:PAP2 superfamily protein